MFLLVVKSDYLLAYLLYFILHYLFTVWNYSDPACLTRPARVGVHLHDNC